MSAAAKALLTAVIVAAIAFIVGLVADKNPWVAIIAAALTAAFAYFAAYDYLTRGDRGSVADQLPARPIPFSSAWRLRRLVAANKLDVAGQRLTAAGDWDGARRLIATYVHLPVVRGPLQHLLRATRALADMQAALPPQTPPTFQKLAAETVADVSHRLWTRTATLARLSQVALPASAEAELAAEAEHIENLAQQAENAATDLLRLSLAGYDAQGLRHGTELLGSVRHKADILLHTNDAD